MDAKQCALPHGVLDQCRHSPDLIGVGAAFVLGAMICRRTVLWPTSIAMFTAGRFFIEGKHEFSIE